MAFEQLLQATAAVRREEDRPVSPTLLVGLGGTGKEVLLRFRRLVVERYGSLAALPFLQFVHLDTDRTTTAKEQYNLKSSDDPLHELVRFDPAERIDLTIEGGTGQYTEHINAYPQIKRWFPSNGKIASLGNLDQGAGQIRLASRLGLFHAPNYANLGVRLEQVRTRLGDPGILSKVADLGFQFNPQGLDIFVVCSIAGGTGGGTFLDLGFLLRQFFPNAATVGILMLPSFFRGYAGGERVRANGYAALVELNHYSFGHSFTADWGGTRSELLAPPPFSTTYLIDGINEADLVIGAPGKEFDTYAMIAEVLFQDFSISKFAGMKRATRVNLVNFNLNVYTHNFLNEALSTGTQSDRRNVVGDTYPTRFGSFGLSAISFPTDRVQSACGARLAGEVLDFWEKSLQESPLEKLVTDLLSHPDVSFFQGRLERRDGGGVIEREDLQRALMVWDAGSGKTFDGYIWEKAQSLRSKLEVAPKGQRTAVLAGEQDLLEQFLAKEDSENPTEWGLGVRQIESNARAYLERVKRGIEKRAAELDSDPHLGVAFTLSLLRELKALLRNEQFRYLGHFELELERWVDAAQEYRARLDEVQIDLERHDRQFLFRNDDIHRDLERLVSNDAAEEENGIFFDYFYARVRKQVAKRGKAICEEIDRFLGKDDPTGSGLLGRYYGLLAGFQRLRDRLRAKEVYFSKAQTSDLHLSLYREGDIAAWHAEWMGEDHARHETLLRVGNQLLKNVFRVETVTAALSTIRSMPTDEIEARLLTECKNFFAAKDPQPDALEILFDAGRFSSQQRREMIQRAYSLGKVWLTRAKRGLEHVALAPVRPDQRPCLVGLYTENLPRREEFEEVLRAIRQPGDSEPTLLNLGTAGRGTIVFYNELAGVPAFYPDSITAPSGLRNAYDAYQDKEELHTDKNRFQFGDLIPKTNEEAKRYAESLRAFLLARLLGRLKVKEISRDNDQPAFIFSYRRDDGFNPEDVILGDEFHAIDSLYRDVLRAEAQTDRSFLLRQVEETVERLKKARKLGVYLLLLDFYQKEIYPPRERSHENLTVVQFPPEYAVLAQARSQLQKNVADDEEKKQLQGWVENLLGKRLGEEVGYDDYRQALAAFSKPAGKVAKPVVNNLGTERLEYLPVFALDLSRIDPSAAPSLPKKAVTKSTSPSSSGAEAVPKRPCPKCDRPIDARALFCTECRQPLGRHFECPHCHETKVPDDLEHCWSCGNRMRQEEKLTCPKCFSYTAYEEEYPCPVCGHSPLDEEEPISTAGPGEPAAPWTKPSSAGRSAPSTVGPSPIGVPSASASDRSSSAEPPQLVECTTCFSAVEPGLRCSVCGGLLEAA